MKTTTLFAAALAASLGTQTWAEAPKMKMSTPVPEGIATPDKLETSIGTLTSIDGVPDAETTQKVFDNLDLNRATEAFLNGIPIASMYALKHGLLNLPPNVPAKDFWSFTLYDNQTRGMLQTDQRFPGVDSNKEGLKQNADGSFDVYFGPKAPEGQENNWIQTDPSKGWNTILRLYGPLEPFYDKTWKPGDPELVE
jgi:hypothetical protein